jgi:hypothetical protein
MAVPDAVLLLAMGRARARIHVEHDATRRSSAVHKIDPLTGQVGKRREVLVCRKPPRLKAPHLARRSCAALSRLAADDPAHRRIMTQALGVVHVFVSGKPTEHRLPQHPDQIMATVPAGTGVSEQITRHRGQPKCIVEFAIGKQPGIRCRHGAAKLEHQAAVKIEPKSPRIRFTRRVHHHSLAQSTISC